MTWIKKTDKELAKVVEKRKKETSAYYQKKNIVPRNVTKDDKLTKIEKKWGGKYITKAPKEKLDEDYIAGKNLVFDDETIPNIMVANIKEIKLDSVEAFIYRQKPRMQKMIRKQVEERYKENKRVNLNIAKNIKKRIKDDEDNE